MHWHRLTQPLHRLVANSRLKPLLHQQKAGTTVRIRRLKRPRQVEVIGIEIAIEVEIVAAAAVIVAETAGAIGTGATAVGKKNAEAMTVVAMTAVKKKIAVTIAEAMIAEVTIDATGIASLTVVVVTEAIGTTKVIVATVKTIAVTANLGIAPEIEVIEETGETAEVTEAAVMLVTIENENRLLQFRTLILPSPLVATTLARTDEKGDPNGIKAVLVVVVTKTTGCPTGSGINLNARSLHQIQLLAAVSV